MRPITLKFSAVLLLLLSLAPLAALAQSPADPLIERGRYLASIAGCNDCHTTGWMQTEGNVPEADWLQGDPTGWHGPWGTTYAINLRLYFNSISEESWLTAARNLQSKPPMPFWALRIMSDEDLKAIYRFVKSLGPKGEPARAFVPPGTEPPLPYFALHLPPAPEKK